MSEIVKPLDKLLPFVERGSIIRLKSISEEKTLFFFSDTEDFSTLIETGDITRNTIVGYTKPKMLSYKGLKHISKSYNSTLKSTANEVGLLPVLRAKKGVNNIVDFTEFTVALTKKFNAKDKRIEIFSDFLRDMDRVYFQKKPREKSILIFTIDPDTKYFFSLLYAYTALVASGDMKALDTYVIYRDITNSLQVVCLHKDKEGTNPINTVKIRSLYNVLVKEATTALERAETMNTDEDQTEVNSVVQNPSIPTFAKEIVKKAMDDGLVLDSDISKIKTKKNRDEVFYKSMVNAIADTNTSNDLRSYDKNLYDRKMKEVMATTTMKDKAEENLELSISKIDSSVSATDPDGLKVTHLTSNVLRSQYRDKLLDRDLVTVMSSMTGNADMPLFLKDVTKEKFDDGMNSYDTYKFSMTNLEGKNIPITVNIPTLIEDKYYLINGNRYVMYNQLVSKPIVKIKEDTVAITTSYNKNFVYRFGEKGRLNKHNRVLNSLLKDPKLKDNIVRRVAPDKNLPFKFLNLDTGNIAVHLERLKLDNGDELIFTPENYKFNTALNLEVIGLTKDGFEILTNREGLVFILKEEDYLEHTGTNLLDYIIKNINIKLFITHPKTLISRIDIIGKKLPLILVLMCVESIKKIFKLYNTKYELFPLNERVSESADTILLTFNDMKLLIHTNTLTKQILFNPLKSLVKNSLDQSVEDFFSVKRNKMIFDSLRQSYINGIRNSIERMIDPITLEILKKDLLPTNAVELLLYANSMLTDNNYKKPSDFNNYRIRNEETFAAIIYRSVSNEINKQAPLYKNNKRSYSVSLNPDFLIREMITTLPNVAPLSSSSPFYEMDELNKLSFSGFLGLNSSRSATMDLRMPDESQKGLVDTNAITDNDRVGLIKYLPLNYNIKDLRGNIHSFSDEELSKTPSKGLSLNNSIDIGVASRADSSRVAMGSIQSRHLNPIDGGYSKPILRTGVEDAITDNLSSDWVIRNTYPTSKIKSIDRDKKEVHLESGDVILYKDTVLRNSSAGFYHLHSFTLDTNLRVGMNLKNGDKVAYNDGVFQDNTLAITGRYCTVCLAVQADLMEDAALVSSDLAEKMVMKYIFDKEVVINPSEKLLRVVNIGDIVEVDDVLIEMETRVSDENFMNSPLFDELDDIGNTVKSKVHGEVVDIKFYSNRKELGKAEIELIKKLEKIPYNKSDLSSKRVFLTDDQRLLGRKLMDSVIIHIFVKTLKAGARGSKITMQSTKAIYSVKDSHLMPVIVGSGETVDVQISSLSLVTRMVVNNLISGYLAKIVHQTIQRLKKETSAVIVRRTLSNLVSSLYRGAETKDLLQSELARINTYTDKVILGMIEKGDFYINVKPFREPNMERIREMSSLLDVPLEEYVTFPDQENMISEKPVPILYIPIKFLNQIVSKGVSQSHKVDEVNSETGQLTQSAKTRQLSVDESLNLFSYGVQDTVLPELTLFRSDDREAFNSMERQIVEFGEVSISDISSKGQAHTANALGSYLLAAGYENNIRQDISIKMDKKSVDTRERS